MNNEVSESEPKPGLGGWKYGIPIADWLKYKGEDFEDSVAGNPGWAQGTT